MTAADAGSSDEETGADAGALLRQTDFLLFWACRFTNIFAHQVLSIAIGWQVYAIARVSNSIEASAFQVGLVGLATFVPIFVLTLPAGETADRHDRKTILKLCLTGQILVAAALTVVDREGWTTVPFLIGASAALGALRAYSNPAIASLGPTLVPRPLLPRAIAWNSLAMQTGRIGGPAVAGVLIALSATGAYAVALAGYGVALVMVALIRKNARPTAVVGSRWALMREGISYVWRNKVVFGAISLDLFAVLLGGATALLPVFARDILHVGSAGFGVLRSAPAVGAALVGFVLAVTPVNRRAGLWMFGGVAAFGIATITFALSRWLCLSIAALAVLGGADMLSVFVRQSLIQLSTPDAMRGRVSAVASVFVGASNELGEFESGIVARFTGPVIAALIGGIGALFVTASWAVLFPALRKADRLG